MDKKYIIKEIESIKLYNIETGEEIKDVRDEKPVEKKFNPNIPILDLVKSSCPSYELTIHPLIKKYGYGTFGMIVERWYWRDNLSEASELELWQILALIKADEAEQYKYWYKKEVYEFRQFKRDQGIDMSIKFKPTKI